MTGGEFVQDLANEHFHSLFSIEHSCFSAFGLYWELSVKIDRKFTCETGLKIAKLIYKAYVSKLNLIV